MSAKGQVIDPIKFGKLMWPDVTFYGKQKDIIYWVHEAEEVFVHAGNMLGKDFVSAFIVLHFFLSRSPCRIVTTSADHGQLSAVLWGEIGRFIQTARYPLEHDKGGPLMVNDLHLRKVLNPCANNSGARVRFPKVCKLSYVIGRVAKKGEGMLGHHIAETGDGIPRTLFLADEASGVEDIAYERADTWAKRKLIIGNPYPCQTFFFHGVMGGDIPLTGKK